MSQSEFKILSIDGGGIRGLYSACVLREIEQVNGPVAEHFDMICGTSTGGLIALALAAGRSAEEIVEFYQDWGPRIFPQGLVPRLWRDTVGFYVWRGKYSDRRLREAVGSILGERRMREANSYVCIPSVEIRTASPYVFKTDHDRCLTRDSDMLMADVAMATSAAPFYFPVVSPGQLQRGEYVDGGLWANNPALVGLIEAYRFFAGPGKPYASVGILSIPTVSPVVGYSVGHHPRRSVRSFAKAAADITFEAQQRATINFISLIGQSLDPSLRHERIPAPIASAQLVPHLKLDVASKQAVNILMGFGHRVGQEYNTRAEIVRFFNERAAKPIFNTRKRGEKSHGEL